MRLPFRSACQIAAGLILASNSYAQQMDGWPEWLVEAMAAEAGTLETAEFAIEDGPYSFTLPKNSSGPNAFDGGWYFESEIDSDAVLECYIFTGDTDLASLTSTLAELSIETTAGANGGNADNRSIFAVDAGHLDGTPYLGIEWIYTVGEAPNALVAYTKVRAASNKSIAQACTHTAVGYSNTFKDAFEQFVKSAQQPAPVATPYYEEIILQQLSGQPIGSVQVRYTLDEDGDTRIDTTSASLIQIGPDAVATSDTYSVSWSTPDGMLINTLMADAQNGELITNLTLSRNGDNDWQVSGTFQGKQLEHTIDGSQEPISELGSVQIAKDFFAGDATEVSFPMWIPDADPTTMLQGAMQRADKDTKDKAVISLGPIEMQAVYAESGMMTDAALQMGATELNMERVWYRGEIE